MTRKICQFLVFVGFLLVLTGCGSRTFAPVDEGWKKPSDVGGVYQAKQGETLQDIAWRFNLSVKRLAKLNNLTPPYTLQKGQLIYLTPEAKAQSGAANNPLISSTNSDENETNNVSSLSNTNEGVGASESHLTVEPVQSSESEKIGSAGGVTSMVNGATSPQKEAVSSKKSDWQWPIKGQVVSNFSESSKGMEIKGTAGEEVAASRGGQVVYSGNGLPGYGNLVMIKHPDGLMSVYAQNRKLLVKEGEHVQTGQAIAEVGDNSTLHFEIRKGGKPVNPATYLGN